MKHAPNTGGFPGDARTKWLGHEGDFVMRSTIWRAVSGLLCAAMILCMMPVLAAPVGAETGYDRGYTGAMAGDGKIYAHGLDVSAWQETGLNFQNFANAGYDQS